MEVCVCGGMMEIYVSDVYQIFYEVVYRVVYSEYI
jgi:hypothetical protein